ncbi:MAG: aldo/keto reductase [Deltaproteobacteria bacterium]|nr:aldo/keto reductase [Deltaproteobacteria bacterium]MCB9789176.1 aldo/keto reductase [Deltaproteobacteria bacterium]
MEYRFVGRTGMRVSKLALGTMAFGTDADERTSEAIFQRALDAGINHFDTADVYGGGRSEELLGRFIRPHRDRLVLATKAYFPSADDPNARGASRYHLVRAVEGSLRRLGTDRVDLLYVHRHDAFTAPEETLRALDDLVRSGKVLYPALSNYAAWQAMQAVGLTERMGLARPVCIQPMYNLVKRQAEVELLPMAEAVGLGVFPYSPLGGGLLSGKYGTHARPASGRLVDNAMYQTRYGDPQHYTTAERFDALARERGHHPVSLAIAWVAHHPAVTAPLIGARNLEQLEPALAAADLPMDDALHAEIAALSPTPPPATDRNEERSAHNYGAR